MQNNERWQAFGNELRTQATILGGILALMWLIEITDTLLLGGSLDSFGVRPRSIEGLRGILFGPFLHAGFAHLLANSMPFLVLGWLVMMRRRGDFIWVSVITAVVSGLGIWLIAPARSIHIGASGLIFGYFGFLLLRGYFEKSLGSIVWSVIVALLYGGLLFGVLPQGNNISWQAHLFGFAGGILAAYLLAEPRTIVRLRDAPPDLADDIKLLE